jgi:hypothetical protein
VKLENWLTDEAGLEALMYYFLHRDISKFNVRKNYYAPELNNQKILSLKDEDRWFFERLNSGKFPIVDDISFIDENSGASQRIVGRVAGAGGSEKLIMNPDDGVAPGDFREII